MKSKFLKAMELERELRYKEAFEKFLVISKKGHSVAQFKIGYYYEKGLGVPKNSSLSLQWYRKSAEKNNPLALYNLGIIHANGNIVKKNLFKARKFLFLARRFIQNNSFIEAQFPLNISLINKNIRLVEKILLKTMNSK